MDNRQNAIRHRQGADPSIGGSLPRLTIVQAVLAESWERLWPLLIPAFMLVCSFLALSWFGLWQILPPHVRWLCLFLFGIGFVASLWPLRRFALPNMKSAKRRIERNSGIPHRPVSLQSDEPIQSDNSFSRILWHEHKRRMARQIENLAVGAPKPNGNRFDRYALRAILPVIAFVAYGFSFSSLGGTIGDIIKPKLDRQAILSRMDLWISPPSYIGKVPIYFSAGNHQDAQAIPAATTLTGSKLHLHHVGNEELTVRFVSNQQVTVLEPSSRVPGELSETLFLENLDTSGILELTINDEPLTSWNISITEDLPPTISFNQAPTTGRNGGLELDYAIKDDYGIVSAKGIISPLPTTRPADVRPLVDPPELKLSLPGSRAKSGSIKTTRDFSNHPWAGSEIELVLEVADDPGQTGRSKPIAITLPGRPFFDPLARALVEQRRLLARNANDAPHVANLLDAIMIHAEMFEMDMKTFLAMKTTYRMIASAHDDNKLREAPGMLWETALGLELGDLSEAERKLREAEQNLLEALENGTGDEELDRLMSELRDAMDEFLEQLARDMAQNPINQNQMSNLENMQSLSRQDLERMMQRIEDLAKSGSKDAAREMLDEMRRMMENLRAGRHQQQRQAEGNEMNQALDKLSELMQRQQQLMDETFDMQRRQPGNPQADRNQQGQQNDSNQQQNNSGQRADQNGTQEGDQEQAEMTPEEFAEALEELKRQQEELQKQLSELGDQLEDLGLDPSEEFGEAQSEMGQAGDKLGKGKPGEAAGDQGQALEALRKGARSMMEQMAGDRNQGGEQQGQAGRNGNAQSTTDPLGRRNNGNGRFGDDNTNIPGEIDAQRAREVLEAIRKRLSNPLQPLIERDYLERLLKSR